LDHNLGSEIYNDRVATDSVLNMIFTYNDNPDPFTTGMQYAIGHRLVYFTGAGKNSRLHSSNAYINGADPGDDSEIYNLMRGLNIDGSLYDSSIVGSGGGKFIYPGDPVTGTGTLCPFGRNGRLMANVGPFTLESGKSYDVIFAVIGGEASDRLAAITDLRNAASDAVNIFNALILPELDLE
jgi:hypothetical protein